MLILGLLGMYFDAAVVFVTSQTLLFRLALAILWYSIYCISKYKGHPGRYIVIKGGANFMGHLNGRAL
jgi:xanthosine utilization system XapX-like protein